MTAAKTTAAPSALLVLTVVNDTRKRKPGASMSAVSSDVYQAFAAGRRTAGAALAAAVAQGVTRSFAQA